MTLSGRRVFILGVIASGALGAATSRGAEPRWRGVFPAGVSREGTTEITLEGSDLAGVHALVVSAPGITAERRSDGRFAVHVAGDVPEQDVDVWALGTHWLSQPLRLAVSDPPQVVEREKNDGEGAAQSVELPVVIDGTLNPATDRDDYVFSVEAGRRVAIVFRSESLGGSVRPALTVFAPDGRELLHDDGGQSEPILELAPSAAGRYRVRVEDRAYQRDALSTYRLALVTGPRLAAAFPAVATRGKPRRVTLYGSQLAADEPARPSIEADIDTPTAGAPDGGGWTPSSAVLLDGFAYRHPGSHGRVRFGLVDEEVTPETDRRHDTLETAQDATPGAWTAGRFLHPGEVDWYRFPARKGESFWIEAVGERAGLAMDLDVAIHDTRGKLLQSLADTPQPRGAPPQLPLDTLDPMGEWKAPADGPYALMIRDLYGPSLAGVTRSYRLFVGPPRPAFRVVAMPAEAAAPRGLALKPGATATLSLIAVRRGGHNAPILVGAADLPPGLDVRPATIPAGALTATLTLAAAQDAPAWVGPLSLRAESEVDGRTQAATVRGATVVREGKPPVVRLTGGVVAAVVE
jgi:hypothetical protein